MGRKKKVVKIEKRNPVSQIKWKESYLSLILGALVVLVAVSLAFVFSKDKNYDRINTGDSTVELSSPEGSQKTYEVKAGDTLWSISEKVYGSGYSWAELAKANNIQNPSLIEKGLKIKVPEIQKITVASAQPTQNNSPSISADSYKVVEGDNLWGIAVRAYGDGYKWPELAKANNIQNPDLIYAGSTLKLPR
jgi:nucleoid-associated protein YgaU